MTIKKSGFAILEIIAMMFILVAISTVYMNWLNNKQLLNSSKAYADQSYNYALLYIKYVHDNESSILALSGDKSIISFADIYKAGYVESNISSYNIYGQTPCLIVTKSSNNKQLFPILVFVGGNSVNSYIANRSMLTLGGVAGVFSQSSQSIFGSLGQWSYSDIDKIPLEQSCGGSITDNSIAVNLGMMSEYHDYIATDLSLHKTLDTTTDLGYSSNANTLLTDISVESMQKVYWGSNSNSSNAMYLSTLSGDNSMVQATNANFKADKLQASAQFDPGTACAESEIGSIANEKISHPEYEYSGSNLVCTYLPPACQVEAGSDYCYLPEKNNTVIYNVGNSGESSTTFICPGSTPVATSGIVNNYGTEVAYYYKCNDSGTYDACRKDTGGKYLCKSYCIFCPHIF